MMVSRAWKELFFWKKKMFTSHRAKHDQSLNCIYVTIFSIGVDFDVKVTTMFDVPFSFEVKVESSNILEFMFSLMSKGSTILILFYTMWFVSSPRLSLQMCHC